MFIVKYAFKMMKKGGLSESNLNVTLLHLLTMWINVKHWLPPVTLGKNYLAFANQ